MRIQSRDEQVGSRNVRVAHLTSAHPRNDARIFIKQCRSLAACGYDVSLVVADGKGPESKDGVKISDVGRPRSRLNRMLRVTRRILQKAVDLDADLYHLHDPELIPVGVKLKHLGKRIVFDSHEDVPKQILGKPYLGSVSRHGLSVAFSVFERYACSRFDGIIAATPQIRDKFLEINPMTTDVNNFPVLGELDGAVEWEDKRDEICYVGSIGSIRGAREMVRACEYLRSSVRLSLAGRFYEPAVEAEVRGYPGWARVNPLGLIDRVGVRDVLNRSVAGLVIFHAAPNHLHAQPNKMFEYMSAGIPVIASNFAMWRAVIEGVACGVCVDPLNPIAIADAIDRLVHDRQLARDMGRNGRVAVSKQYNWGIEEGKLVRFYSRILDQRVN